MTYVNSSLFHAHSVNEQVFDTSNQLEILFTESGGEYLCRIFGPGKKSYGDSRIPRPDVQGGQCGDLIKLFAKHFWNDDEHPNAGIEPHFDELLELAQIGKELFEAIFESSVQKRLRGWLRNPQNSCIQINDFCHVFPWELLYFEEELPDKPLKNATNLEHQSPFAGFVGYDRVVYRPGWCTGAGEEDRAFLKKVGLSESDFADDADNLARFFESRGFSVRHLGQETPNDDVFSRRRFKRDWALEADIVHVFGHYVTGQGEAVGLKIAGGVIESSAFSNNVAGLPLVFLNSCRFENEGTSILKSLLTAVSVRNFPEGNPWCVISPDVKVERDAARRFEKCFYELLFSGQSAHEAVRIARMKLLDDPKNPNPIGLAYGYHGQLDFRLPETSVKRKPSLS